MANLPDRFYFTKYKKAVINRYGIGGSGMHTISDKKLLMIRPEELNFSLNRIRKSIEEQELKKLAQSIAANGIIEPIAIRRDLQGRFQLISGERRVKAAIIAGLRRVPCILHNIDESDLIIYSLIENIHSVSLSPFEIAQGIEQLIAVFGMSQTQVSAKLGISRTELVNKLRLLHLSEETRFEITQNNLSEQIALSVLNLSGEQREKTVKKIICEGMNENEAEQYIKKQLFPIESVVVPLREDKPVRKSAIGDVRLFSNSLTKLIETLQSAGVSTTLRKYESENYIEYRVKIKKETQKTVQATQLRLL